MARIFITDGSVFVGKQLHEVLGGITGAFGLTLHERSIPLWLARTLAATIEKLWSALSLR